MIDLSNPEAVIAEKRRRAPVRLTLHVPPSANRWHRVVNGRPILSREARLYTKAAELSALSQRVKKIPAPTDIAVSITWYRARKSGDVDKRGAVLLDALQGIAFDNDAQIAKYTIERDDSEPKHSRMEITITPTE